MRHLGDITKISGFTAPVVDIITGGSPCQDLSIAGKREGLKKKCHNYRTCGFETDANSELNICPLCGSYLDLTRSGLFVDQIRIIKEMRENEKRSGRSADAIRPRYMVWENVPGAFSSNKGEDFRAVLEETARIAKEDAIIPGLEGGEKWRPAGCIMGDGWSIAWRVHDAQFWGVPQRRKRIALVADFGGQTAPEILFERKGMPGNPAESEEPRKGTAGDFGKNATKAIGFNGWQSVTASMPVLEEKNPPIEATMPPYCLQGNAIDMADTAGCNGKGWKENQSYTLNTIDRHAVCAVENHPADSRIKISKDGTVQTLSSRMGTGGGNVPMVMSLNSKQQALATGEEIASSLGACDYKEPQAVCIGNGQTNQSVGEKTGAINCMHDQQAVITYGLDRASFNQGQNAKYNFSVEEEKIGAQVARGPGAICKSVVRRLTPLECERLQGYPDYWTDIGDWVDSKGKKHKGDSDSPRYKALGNSIALPFWQWIAERMCRYIENPTMASLFDGIGGFPLVYSRCGCVPVWASEIEEFPVAVTKIRFEE